MGGAVAPGLCNDLRSSCVLRRSSLVSTNACIVWFKTTEGIWIARCAGIKPCTLVLDLEGTDGKEQGEKFLVYKKALQSTGVDPQPIITVAKAVVDTAQQTTKVIEGAKPIASTTVKTISSSDPTVISGTGGALFIAYLLLPPIWSGITFNFRGYKALKISYLKKINKGSNILIMDSGVVSPSRVIPAAVRGFGTTSQSSTKLLPGAD
ncbi:hypothetical protein AHAS_Ahas20G0175700 [Arachis hypogaea]